MKNTQDKIIPVLTISLLVSNRIDTIRKCMESLQLLVKAIPSELIAVDTGGTDGSIETVKEYTENIVKFDWCDNFAAARNAGLKRASGEWFLFLDDDEWFENTEEIEEFFLTGDYKNYGSAQYLVRNYASDGSWGDAYVSRMCKINPKLHFAGSIHEYLTPVYAPVKYFSSFVHHYGYCYSTEEDKIRHFERNVTLLKKELRKDPTNIRNLCQLAQEYETISDLKNEEAICRLALNYSHDSEIAQSTGINWIMAALIRILAVQDRDEDTLKEGKKLLDKGLPYELSRAVILAYMQEKSVKIKAYSDALIYAEEYVRIIELLETNFEMQKTQSMLTMTFSYAQGLYGSVMANGLEACCGMMNFKNAQLFLNWLFNNENVVKIKNGCIFIENLKEKYPTASWKLTELLATLENKNQIPYLLLQQLYVKCQSEDGDIQSFYDNCVKRCLEEHTFLEQLLAVAGQKNLMHTVMIEYMERKEWEDWLMASAAYLTTDELWGVKNGLNRTPASGLKYLSYVATLDRQLLIKESEQIKEENNESHEMPVRERYYNALYSYCEEGLCYFRRLYKNEVFIEEEGINLPKECRFLLYLENGFQLEKKGNLMGCLNQIKKAVNVNPQMAATISPYIDMLKQAKTNPVQKEFNQLGENIKHEARNLIEKEDFDAAFSILKQLQNLTPDDTDIPKLMKQIELKL